MSGFDKAKAKAEELKGAAKEKVGDATDNQSLQGEGVADQASGKAKQAAEEVNRRALANDFDALAIIAPPKTLGELRKQLHKQAARRVVCEIPKEMTGHTIPAIEALLIGTTRPEELAAE